MRFAHHSSKILSAIAAAEAVSVAQTSKQAIQTQTDIVRAQLLEEYTRTTHLHTWEGTGWHPNNHTYTHERTSGLARAETGNRWVRVQSKSGDVKSTFATFYTARLHRTSPTANVKYATGKLREWESHNRTEHDDKHRAALKNIQARLRNQNVRVVKKKLSRQKKKKIKVSVVRSDHTLRPK